jgi:hypothetical protein
MRRLVLFAMVLAALAAMLLAALAPASPASAAGGSCRVSYSGRPAVGNSPPGPYTLALRASGWGSHVTGSVLATHGGRVVFRSLRLAAIVCNDYDKTVDLYGIGVGSGRRVVFALKIVEAQMNVARHIIVFNGAPGTKPVPLQFQHDRTTSFDGFVPYFDVSLSITSP